MKQGLPKAEAQAQSIAAQIWAEMLGMVCHRNITNSVNRKVKKSLVIITGGLMVRPSSSTFQDFIVFDLLCYLPT